jgi:hypothetical protein
MPPEGSPAAPGESRWLRYGLDPLRAGMQLAGSTFFGISGAVVLNDTLHVPRATVDWAVLAWLLASITLTALFGYPAPRRGLGWLLGRALAAIVSGIAIGGLIFVVLERTVPAPEASKSTRALLFGLGAALVALGLFPRRKSAMRPAPGPGAARAVDLAGALIPGLLAAGALLWIEGGHRTRWVSSLPRFLRVVPDAAALSIGLAAGIGLVVFAASALRARERPRALLVLPAVPLAAAFAGQWWTLRTAARPSAPLMDRLATSGPAMVQGGVVAAAGLALGALLLTGASLAYGFAGRPPPAERSAGARRVLAIVAGVVALLAAPVALEAWRRGSTFYNDPTSWLGAVPAALGVLAIVAAAAALPRTPEGAPRAAADVLIAAASALAAVLLLGAGRGLFARGLLEDLGEVSASVWAPIAAEWMDEVPMYLRTTALFGVAVVLALVAVLPPRLAVAGARAGGRELGVLAAAVILPALAIAGLTRRSAGELVGAWAHELPPGFEMPLSRYVDRCDDVDVDRVLFVGRSRLTLGRRDLGPTSALDTDEGCAAAALATDAAVGRAELAVAADASAPAAALDCLERALGKPRLRPTGPRRRPRCTIQALSMGAVDKAFPRCETRAITSEACPKDPPVR